MYSRDPKVAQQHVLRLDPYSARSLCGVTSCVAPGPSAWTVASGPEELNF